jgi:hypothetical protein
MTSGTLCPELRERKLPLKRTCAKKRTIKKQAMPNDTACIMRVSLTHPQYFTGVKFLISPENITKNNMIF